jgi:phenylacetate-CoA ligase
MERVEQKLALEEVNMDALRIHLQYLADHSPFYKRFFTERGIDISRISSIADFQKIPTFSKDDIQLSHRDFWAVDKSQIADYSATSGTQGQPITIPLSHSDVDRLAEVERQSFERVGINANDTILLTTTINRRFMAGLAYTLGAKAIGAGMVRTGPGLIEQQWDTIRELEVTVIIAVPSFVVKMLQYAKANGIDVNTTSVKKIICIGEAIRTPDFELNALGQQIVSQWNVELFSTYASSEMQTAFTECSQHKGGHASSDLIYAEILDADGNPTPVGTPGELVITTLGVTGFPLLRFRTGDVCTLYIEPCSCGDNSPRLGPVLGRLKQMIKYKGTTCYPLAISGVLDSYPEISEYQIRLEKDALGNDAVSVFYHASEALDLEALKESFSIKVRFVPELKAVSEAEINKMVHPEAMRKAQRLVDLR